MTRLWQGWDSEGSFGAVPASPLLLPAVLLIGLARLIGRFVRMPPGPMPAGFNLEEYRQNRREWLALYNMPHYAWNAYHVERWHAIQSPSWAKPGEVWSYDLEL